MSFKEKVNHIICEHCNFTIILIWIVGQKRSHEDFNVHQYSSKKTNETFTRLEGKKLIYVVNYVYKYTWSLNLVQLLFQIALISLTVFVKDRCINNKICILNMFCITNLQITCKMLIIWVLHSVYILIFVNILLFAPVHWELWAKP